MMKLQAIEFVFQFPYLSDIGIHLLVVAVLVFVDLENDEGRIPKDHESFDAKLDGYIEAVQRCFILYNVIGSPEVNPKNIAQLVPE
jgi:hypothetical protein